MEASRSSETASRGVLLVEDLAQQRLPARSLAAVLQRDGCRVGVVDLNLGGDAVVALARARRPRLIVLSVLFADRLPELLKLARALRCANVPARLALSGQLPALAPDAFRAACRELDVIVEREPEEAIRKLAASLGEGQADARSASFSVDALPFPVQDEELPARDGYRFVTVEASRGCYHDCAFCLPTAYYHRLGMPYRLRGISNLADEMELLYRRGARLFLFDDEQFLAPARLRAARIDALRSELERRQLHLAFTIKCRPDEFDPRLFRGLQEAGLIRCYVGIESGNQPTLDLLKKGTTVEQNREALVGMERLGLVADFHIMVFHPWAKPDSVEQDIAFLQSVLPHISTPIQLRELQVYPGTPIARRVETEGHAVEATWQLNYLAADRRVELLRRLCALLLQPRSLYSRTGFALSAAWFDLLVGRRLGQRNDIDGEARALKESARRINAELLAICREMLCFVRAGDIGEAGEVNARAGSWVERLNASCVPVLDSLYPVAEAEARAGSWVGT